MDEIETGAQIRALQAEVAALRLLTERLTVTFLAAYPPSVHGEFIEGLRDRRHTLEGLCQSAPSSPPQIRQGIADTAAGILNETAARIEAVLRRA